ncbi:homeobox domain protein [Cooperia oncophora]
MLTQKGREPFIRMKLFMREVSQSATKDLAQKELDKVQTEGTADVMITKDKDLFNETDMSPPIKVKREIIEDEEEVIVLPRSEFDTMSTGTPDDAPESGADVEDVDTALLVRKVKDRLHLHGISQRIEAGLPLERNLVNGNGKRLPEPPYEPPPRKVQRTIITEQQKEALRFVFQHEHHPSQKTVELLSLKLNLNIRTVNNWFHNHRTRQKASLKEGKVYPPAVGSIPTSKNWQQDLHAILENASRYALLDDAPPTMVPVPATPLFTTERSANSSLVVSTSDDHPPATNSSSPLFPSEDRSEKASQLDRAVAKMRMLAASKSS